MKRKRNTRYDKVKQNGASYMGYESSYGHDKAESDMAAADFYRGLGLDRPV